MGNTCGDRRIEEVIEPPCLVEVRRRDLPIGQLSEEEIQESIDLLTSLSHPNVIKVQKCVRNANNTLSVFEEYPSESLEHLLNSKRSFINFKEIMIGLATGL
jgi:serine/threonine protein kinase